MFTALAGAIKKLERRANELIVGVPEQTDWRRPMSLMGHSLPRNSTLARPMAALNPKANILGCGWDVR